MLIASQISTKMATITGGLPTHSMRRNWRFRAAEVWLFPVWVLLVLSLFLPSYSLRGQGDYLVDVKQYTTENGLSHNIVVQSFKDSRGFLWFVTNKGLDMFDGQQFINTMQWPLLTTDSKVNILFEDPEGQLWMRFQDRQHVRYQLLNIHTRISTKLSYDRYHIPAHSQVWDIAQGTKGELFVSNLLGQVWRVVAGEKPQKIYDRPGCELSFCSRNLRAEHLWLLSIETTTVDSGFVALEKRGRIRQQLDANNTIQFGQVSGDSLWYINQSHTGYLLPDGRRHQWPMADFSPDGKPVQFSHYEVAMHAESKHIWLFDRGRQLLLLQAGKGHIYNFEQYTGRNLPQNILGLFIDDDETAWIFDVQGLYKIRIRKNRFRKFIWDDPEKVRHIIRNSCRGIQYSQQGYLRALASDKLYNIDVATGKMLQVQPLGIHYPLLEDTDGIVWMAMDKLRRYNPKTQQTQVFAMPKEIIYRNIWSLYQQDSFIWVGHQYGLALFNRYTLEMKAFDQYNQFDVLRNADLYAIQPDSGRRGNLWLVSSAGLFYYEKSKGIVARYWEGGKGRYRFPVTNLRHFARDQAGDYWFASDEGLLYWQPAKRRSRLFTTIDGLPNNNLYSVYKDERNFLWISSDKGIIQFQISTGRLRYFLESDGITHYEFNRISHHRGPDGTLYFGSLNGITSFHPRDFWDDFDQQTRLPLTLISANTLSLGAVPAPELLESYQQQGKLTLKSHQHYLQLLFGLPNFHTPQAIEYSYRIEGLDNRWVYSKSPLLQLAGLPHGEYLLVVKARSGNGIFYEDSCKIPIRILAPFYLQTWFISLLVLLSAATLIWIIRYRIQQLRNRQQELEQEVSKRTRQIVQDKKLIENQAERLQNQHDEKQRFFTNITHEFRTPLALILGPAQKLLHNRKLSTNEISLLTIITNNASRLLNLVNDLLYISTLETQKQEVKPEPVLLETFNQRLLSEFVPLAQQKEIALVYEGRIDPDFCVKLDLRHLNIILNNLLANAIKFTDRHERISYKVNIMRQTLVFVVQDTGRGIYTEDQARIFDLYYQSQHPEAAIEGGTGIGLAIVRELTELMGGRVWVESQEGHGSTFFVELPKILASQEEAEHLQQEREQPDRVLLPHTSLPKVQPHPNKAVGSRPGILLVEDNLDFQKFMSLLLADSYQLEICNDGREAITYLVRHALPDLIICDLMMPNVDGFRLVEQIRQEQRWSNIPILIVTARAVASDLSRIKELGVDDYIIKPFVEEELLTIIPTLINRSRVRAELANTNALTANPTEDISSMQQSEWLKELETTAFQQLERPDFSVDDLAASMHIGRTKFFLTVRKLTGLTPNQYIQEMRLQRARQLLETKAYSSVKKLVKIIGLKDERHFAKLFKQRFGKSPYDYL